MPGHCFIASNCASNRSFVTSPVLVNCPSNVI
uniref:Uncharacterized protein n=1 Tax=Amphimedon queenslandica TaxID=400682 RepID=A0A1X7UJA0_AMPQE